MQNGSLMPEQSTTLSNAMTLSVKNMLRSLKKGDSIISCEQLNGGNNRSYRLVTEDDCYLCKQYFRHQNDTRDRLGAEFAFLRFCDESGIGHVPRALAADFENGIALYSWIEGASLTSLTITLAHVQEAAAFAAALARASCHGAARKLAPAADAAFCVQNYMDGVQNRFAGLIAACEGCGDTLAKEALVFLRQSLLPRWEQVAASLTHSASATQLGHMLPEAERIVSPSDFGFHNALIASDGLYFVDFEYAGMDDPAKLVCDFVCQPAIPALEGSMQVMVRELCAAGQPVGLEQRALELLPLHRLKWCCIILNEFKNTDAKRRSFAKGATNTDARYLQLHKAKRYFAAHLA